MKELFYKEMGMARERVFIPFSYLPTNLSNLISFPNLTLFLN